MPQRKAAFDPETGWATIFIGAIIAGCCVPWLVAEVIDLRRQDVAGDLPSVRGEVMASRVEEVVTDSPTGSTIVYYRPYITYRYEVADGTYESDRFTFQDLRFNKPEATAIVERHPPRATVTVYYQPGDPAVAVIDAREATLSYAPVAVGLMIMLFGLGVLAMGLRSRPWTPAPAASAVRRPERN